MSSKSFSKDPGNRKMRQKDIKRGNKASVKALRKGAHADNSKAYRDAVARVLGLNDDDHCNIKDYDTLDAFRDLFSSDEFLTRHEKVLEMAFGMQPFLMQGLFLKEKKQDLVFEEGTSASENQRQAKLVSNFMEYLKVSRGVNLSMVTITYVDMARWIKSKVFKSKDYTKEKSGSQVQAILKGVVQSKLFNAFYRQYGADEYYLSLSEYASDQIANLITPENSMPGLMKKTSNMDLYPFSFTKIKEGPFKHFEMIVSAAGTVGIEALSGNILQKGKVSLIVDLKLKASIYCTTILYHPRFTSIIDECDNLEAKRREAEMWELNFKHAQLQLGASKFQDEYDSDDSDEDDEYDDDKGKGKDY